MKHTKKDNQGFALKLLLMTALDIQQDIILVDIKPRGDRFNNEQLFEIIKVLESIRENNL